MIKRPVCFDEVIDKMREYLMNAEHEGGRYRDDWRSRLDEALADLRAELSAEEDDDIETSFRFSTPEQQEPSA